MKIKTVFLAFVAMLFVSTTLFAQEAAAPPSADQVLKDALQQAKKEKKSVFIIFHASWCGWCHKMDESMNDPAIKSYFDKNYVIKHLVVMENDPEKKKLENPGAEEMLKKYNSDGFGIPVWFIFDSKGKLLADSHIRPAGTGFEVKGKNIIGCPAAKEEVDEFIKSLKISSSLKDDELNAIAVRFSKNAPAGK